MKKKLEINSKVRVLYGDYETVGTVIRLCNSNIVIVNMQVVWDTQPREYALHSSQIFPLKQEDTVE